MLLHAANNTVAVLATSLPALRDVPWLQEGGEIPVPVIVVVAVLGLIGFGWMLKAGRRSLGKSPV
jgi:hypothetical protein